MWVDEATMNEALELELRQLPGVSFVSFSEDDGTTLIELVVTPSTEHATVRHLAARAAVNHLEGPAEVRVVTPPDDRVALGQGNRVGLLVVMPSDGASAIEVQLYRGRERYTTRAVAGDTVAVGRAVLEALRGLGAQVTFDVVGFHALPPEWGAGVLAVLRDVRTGELRRGVANGVGPSDAAARAVLHALNRSL
jgi:hypothetical protein